MMTIAEFGESVARSNAANRAALADRATPATCRHTEEAMCLGCGASWCYRCDPQAVTALCHYCHGRGYSTAEWCAPSINPEEESAMIQTINPDGTMTPNGYAIHMAHDLDAYGFDGTGYDPVDAALALAALVVELTGQEATQ